MLNDLKRDYDRLLASKTILIANKQKQMIANKKLVKEIKAHIEARDTIAEVIQVTQYQTKKSIEKTVTLAIRSVYDRPYTFHLEIRQSRNKIEWVPTVREGDHIREPKHDMGGGIMDIIAIAFRAILQALESPKSRGTLFLDQPFTHCGSLAPRAFAMTKELSRELPLQIVIITHEKDFVKISDRSWNTTHNGIKSKVTRLLKRR